MPKFFQSIFSNRVELLYLRLKEALFSPPSHAFTRRMIVVPSQAMKSWLMLRMANDFDLKIAAGLEIAYLDQVLKKLSAHKPTELPSLLELALAIEGEIYQIVNEIALAPSSEHSIWRPLLQYLKISPGKSFSQKTERRLTELCEQLATRFSEYGIYGGSLITSWEASFQAEQPLEWQQQLWCRLFFKKWSYPYREALVLLQRPPPEINPGDLQVHLFTLNHLSRLQHSLFMHFAQAIPLYYYLLSPCQAFWTDLASDRERRRLQEYWEKRKISSAQQNALEEYLRDQNPLLANFGRLGREMALQIEETVPQSIEDYAVTSAIESYPSYEELFASDRMQLYETNAPLTLLEGVQADMLLLRTSKEEKIILKENDCSIQVHVASNRVREVQILYDSLLHLIASSTELTPHEIIVMAPHIEEYAPFIHAIFNSRESVLPAQIMELPAPAQGTITQGFLHVLSLAFSRWNVLDFLQLLDSPPFQKRHQFSNEEVHQIQSWIKATYVRWGATPTHRNELLSRDHCFHEMRDNSAFGTWEHAMDRLLFGLVCTNQDRINETILPLENMDATQSPLLGKWIRLMHSLREDLACLTQSTRHSLTTWATYLHCLVDAYFSPHTDQDQLDYEELLAQIDLFRQGGSKLKEERYSFHTIKHHLLALFRKQKENHRDGNLQSVRFCSMLPMRAIPSRVIALLGMEEGAFPKQTPQSSWDLLRGAPQVDYHPTSTDYDRFLFLEILLSVRQHLLILYPGFSSNDGKEQPPSLLVTELMAYLDQTYLLKDKKPSQKCVRHHPFHSFDPAYFTPSSPIPNYSQACYKAAKSYYTSEKTSIPHFIPEFAFTPPLHCPLKRVSLNELSSFARNPIKAYFNKTLGIYLNSLEERVLKKEEDFYPTTLQSYLLKKNAFKQPLEKILLHAHQEGTLPIGAFRSVAIDKISKDITLLQNNLMSLGVSLQDVFQVTLSEQCQNPIFIRREHWLLPPLRVNGILLTGTLSEVSSKGLIATCRDDKSEILKLWPQFLVFACVVQAYQLPLANHLLFTQGGKGKTKSPFFIDPFPLLGQYLDYYMAALESVSPLLPEWVPHLVTQGEEAFTAMLHKSLTDPFNPLYNAYIHWTLRGESGAFCSQTLIKNWKPIAHSLFHDLYTHWYSNETV